MTIPTLAYSISPEEWEKRYAIDRGAWARGPWDEEPDVAQWTDEATGLPCAMRRNSGGTWAAYVGVPRRHPLYEKPYDHPLVREVRVHGWLNYCGPNSGLKKIQDPDEEYWLFGFDCAHSGDLFPRDAEWEMRVLKYTPQTHYRSMDYVKEEVRRLAAHLYALGDEAGVRTDNWREEEEG